MPDYIQTDPEQWLAANGFSNSHVPHVVVGRMFASPVSDILRDFGRLIIDHAIETCDAHSDTDIDKEGAKVNLLAQFGLK